MLQSSTSEYELQHFRFTGCFSQVAECKNINTKEITAIKILKKRANDFLESNRELVMLTKICDLDPDHIVRFYEGFEHKGRTCLAFEMLDKNLHELLRERCGAPLSLQEIKPITRQLLAALKSLKTVGVIHTNIKPHNIMLVNQSEQPFRVKLIDFGSAITTAEVQRGAIMQPVAYRSPDVILGLSISEAIDMWSLGGVLATMYLGSLLFPQRCQYYLMKTIVETLDQPDDVLLGDGTKTLLYFSPNQDSTKTAWRLKTADEYKAMTGFPPQIPRGSVTRFRCLNDLVMLHPEETIQDRMKFVSLLKRMLHVNPQMRITPSVAVRHPFLTMMELDESEGTISQSRQQDSDASGSYDQATDVSIGSADDEAEVNPATSEALTTPEMDDIDTVTVAPTDEFSVALPPAESDDAANSSYSIAEHPSPALEIGIIDVSIGSRSAQETQEKNSRGFFSRMFRALCCCCSVDAEE